MQSAYTAELLSATNGGLAGALRRAAAVLVFGAAALVGGPVARAEDAPIPRTEEFRKRIAASIEKGVAWLKSQQIEDGRFGEWASDIADVARVYHALRVCGVPADDRVATKAYAWLVKEFTEDSAFSRRHGGNGLGTEDMGYMLWAIADRSVAQPPADDTEEISYAPAPADLARMKQIAAYLEKIQLANGAWPAYASVHEAGEADFWHMHLALLGLKLASRSGVPVKPTTWSKALLLLLNQQDSPGQPVPRPPTPKGATAPPAARARGWDMHEKKGSEGFMPNDSNTAAALTSVAICRSEIVRAQRGRPASDPRTEAAIRDGLAFLALEGLHTFDVLEDEKERHKVPDFYFEHAFTIERAGDLLGVERIGDCDWFGRGAEAILANQESSGAWLIDRVKNETADKRDMYRNFAIEATAHALLFLARATPRARWVVTEGGGDADIRFDGAASLPQKDFEDLLDLVLSRWRRTSDTGVKQRLFTKATAIGPRIVEPLIRRLASADQEDRGAAFALLRHATGLDHAYDAAGPEPERTQAAARWRTWWDENAKTLHFDAASGRLVP
jgi:hypothetical protein